MFQGNAFQGNAFQEGPAPVTAVTPTLPVGQQYRRRITFNAASQQFTSAAPQPPIQSVNGCGFLEGLPDRIRKVFYQSLASVLKPLVITAVISPVGAGELVRVKPKLIHDFAASEFFQEAAAVVTTYTSPVVEDGGLRRKQFAFDGFIASALSRREQVTTPSPIEAVGSVRIKFTPYDFTSWLSSAAPAVTPTTAGLQGFDPLFKYPAKLYGFSTESSVAVSTTFGLQGFDAPPRYLIKQLGFLTEAAVTTQTIDGVQDFDLFAVGKSFKWQTQGFITQPIVYAATPITAGVQDFDLFPFKTSFKWENLGFITEPAAVVEVTGASFLDGLPDRINRVYYQSLFQVLSPVTYAATPITAGVQDFDWFFTKKMVQWAAPQHGFIFTPTVAATPSTAGVQDFDLFSVKQSFKWQTHGFITAPTAATVTPTSLVGASFEYRGYFGKWLIADFAGATSTPEQPIFGFQEFDRQIKAKNPVFVGQGFIFTSTVTATPITAGLQNFDLSFVKKMAQWAGPQQGFVFTPTYSATPITAGIQDFDWFFTKKMVQWAAPQHGFIFTPTVAATPTTLASSILDVRGGYVGRWLIADFAGATSTPDFFVAGYQDFNLPLLVKPKPSYFTTNVPVVIVYAATPTAFQFARSDLPPFRYGFKASLQAFMNATLGQELPTPPAVTNDYNRLFIANVGKLMGTG